MQILGWDDEVEEGSPFVLFPEGDYPFVITNLEKGIYEKPVGRESKVPANAPKATVTLEFTSPTGEKTSLQENFFLYKKMQWKINQFFTSIGAQKNAERKVRMNWGSVLGAHGTAKLIVNNYTDKSGNPGQNNRVDSYLEPAASSYQAQQPAQQQPPVTPFPTNNAAPTGNYNFR